MNKSNQIIYFSILCIIGYFILAPDPFSFPSWLQNETLTPSTPSISKKSQKKQDFESNNTFLPPGDFCVGLSSNAIGGTVWEDWNYNGIQDESPITGIEGIQVSLIDDCNNTSVATVTNADGDFLFSSLSTSNTYRVVFTIPPSLAWAKPTFVGADNGSLVQFATPGNCVKLGLASPADYCDDPNPLLATPCYIEGDPTAGGSSGTREWLVSFHYDNAGEIDDANYPSPKDKIDGQKIGATWGLAYQKQTKTLFASAIIKRHSGLGTDGTGGIYKIDFSGTSPVISSFLDLNALTGINTGVNPRDGSPNNSLASAPNTNSRDINAFSAVGKVALGDLEISDDGETLYTINLNDRTLHEIYIGNTPTAPSSVNTYDIISPMASLYPSGCGTAADYRPWALKYHEGRLYIGIICTAESSQITSELHAYVISFDPANPSAGFSQVFDFNLNYTRDLILDYQGLQIAGEWRPWITSWNQVTVVGSDNNAGAPQPVFTDIEFDTDGSMILGLMDRFGHQSGFFSYGSNPSDNDLYIGIAGGDVVRACKSGSTYTLEGGSGCAYNSAIEFYDEDFFYDNDVFGSPLLHGELSFGAVRMLPGKGEVAATIYDPFWIQSGGLAYWNNQNGNTSHSYELYNFSQTSDSGPFGKANGLGDLEFMCAPAPIQIGNYIWNDEDNDGVQDACEAPISGVTIALYKGANKIAETQSNTTGQYYFSSTTANDPNLIWLGSGIDTALIANTNYTIRIENAIGSNQQASLAGYHLTTSNAQNNAVDQLDSDAVLNGTNADINVTTGSYGVANHSLDVGFIPCQVNVDTNDISIFCDDNGTGGINTDDTFTVQLTATTTSSIGTQFEVVYNNNVLNTGGTNYNELVTLSHPDFQATGNGTITLIVRDKNDTGCNTNVEITIPANCSSCPPPICLPVNIIPNYGTQ